MVEKFSIIFLVKQSSEVAHWFGLGTIIQILEGEGEGKEENISFVIF